MPFLFLRLCQCLRPWYMYPFIGVRNSNDPFAHSFILTLLYPFYIPISFSRISIKNPLGGKQKSPNLFSRLGFFVYRFPFTFFRVRAIFSFSFLRRKNRNCRNQFPYSFSPQLLIMRPCIAARPHSEHYSVTESSLGTTGVSAALDTWGTTTTGG